jgi:TatD DNase family protein
MLIDTHAHLNFNAFKDDIEEVIRRCSDAEVGVINVGSQYSTSKRAVEMAEKYEDMWACIGLHPSHLSEHEFEDGEGGKIKSAVEKFDQEKYIQLAKSKKVVAIGEIGLDYYSEKSKIKNQNEKLQFKNKNLEEEKILQKQTFIQEIELAIELDLPVMVHCREAYKDLLEILVEQNKKYGKKLRGVIHSYLGRLSYAQEFIKMDFSIAFNGIITYARDYDKVIKNINLKYILIETDCPWLTPVPHRGERNEPAYVRYVAEKIAEIKGISFDEVAKATVENAKKIFNI